MQRAPVGLGVNVATLPRLAHLGQVELLTPRPERSLDVYVEATGLTVSDSGCPRGWDDYEHHTPELTGPSTERVAALPPLAAAPQS